MSNEIVSHFNQLPLSAPVLEAIDKAGFVEPTLVQKGVIPLAVGGIDLIVQSQTGSGKTGAFAIPVAEMTQADPGCIQTLVLLPTRELALQVTDEFRRLGCDQRDLSVVTVYGGASINDQINKVKSAEILVATPGRMLDLLQRKAANLDTLRILILDEADEMLSMGFEKELRAILAFLPKERQSMLFSATVDENIKSVAKATLFYPEFLSYSSDSVAAEKITHYYYTTDGVNRFQDLHTLIQCENPDKALIFCNTKDDTFRVAQFLKQHDLSAEAINGDLAQREREKVLGKMRGGNLRFLVATDIAARGIDISFLPCVINFMLSESADSYIHRTGRTGRAGREGVALSLIAPTEIGMLYQLRKGRNLDLTQRSLPTHEELFSMRKEKALDEVLDGLDASEDLDYGPYLALVDSFHEQSDSRSKLAKLMAHFAVTRLEGGGSKIIEPHVSSPAKAQQKAPEKSASQGGERKDRGDQKRDKSKSPGTSGKAGEKQKGDHARLKINLGRTQMENDSALICLLTELSGMDESDFKNLEMKKSVSWVDVSVGLAEDVIAAVDQQDLEGHRINVTTS